ncbi:malto-oligosyltrehalose trehalohydrolase [Pseudonocardia eucalypti]|uniref:Malto-oligosyltrehalose trehalohydrolase n=1 Tax=Pseudonocardia eucalypti TaxID=648755 RepID=A0ABP9QVW1_9PSEU|nr:maltooligosyltrehalose trehalohydrolase [Pseudonocardia eucalypti]
MEFEVWAPGRNRVQVEIDGGRRDLTSEPDGWWRVEVPGAGHGTDYAYLLDDDPTPLPDPRSRHQPHGVHRPSRVYRPETFAWTDHAWTGRALPGSVVYELHVGTFTPAGTFDSAIERLDHLVGLGVDLVEVLPVNAFDGPRNWGYDGVLWYAATENYGGPDAFCRFVDSCHARGLGVLLDAVYNHLGPSGAYLDRFGPYFAGRNIWGPTLNLDGPGSDQVRRYVIDNALMWLRDFHVDGLRLDAVHALVDTRAVHVLEELAVEVAALEAHVRRPLTLIAESDLNNPRLVTAREGGGYGLQAQWNDDVHHQLHAALTGERQGYYGDFGTLPGLAATLRGAFFHADTMSTFRGRHHGRPVNTALTPGHRFLAYLQNHDQIGNRATGDRISAALSPGLLACGAALVLCSPYTPMLFMGEEWGARTPWRFFSHFPDADLREAIRRGRVEEFAEHGWDAGAEVPDPNAERTFLDSKLDWTEPDREPHAGLLRTYRELIALRRARPELSDPWLDRLGVEVDEAARTVLLRRRGLRVLVNLGGTEAGFRLDGPVRDALLASAAVRVDGAKAALPGESFAVVELEG